MLQGIQQEGRERGREGAREPPARWTALHIWLGALGAAPCSKASAKGRTQGWLQQLAPPNVSSYVCEPVMAVLPRGPSPVSPRSGGTVPCVPMGRQSHCVCHCWHWGDTHRARGVWAPARAAGVGWHPGPASCSPGSEASVGPTLPRCPEGVYTELSTNPAVPRGAAPLLTFFLTARGCSVARITRSFCRAPPSMASICTLGLLQG